MSKEENITIFKDTERIYNTDRDLIEAIKKQNTYTQVIPEDKSISVKSPEGEPIKVIVRKSKTFDAARQYTEGKTAVLNFASATTPGGGVIKGSSAQEECLCRVSTLYPTLSSKRCWDNFYLPHRAGLNSLHNDDIIWTPDVIVFKDDDYHLLDRKDWKSISVISCAAPNLREKNPAAFNVDKPLSNKISNQQLFDIHYKRALRIFTVAAIKGVNNLIVGAFGCGAFKNDPSIVAKAWNKAIEDFYSANLTIDFAIYDNQYSNNFDIFNSIIKNNDN